MRKYGKTVGASKNKQVKEKKPRKAGAKRSKDMVTGRHTAGIGKSAGVRKGRRGR